MYKTIKPRVGIIGAGAAGLVTAWLLEHDYEVMVFEKDTRLGGHIYTKSITVANKETLVECGTEFFADSMSAQFNRLLQILQVPVKKYALTYTFYNTKTNISLQIPPLHDGHLVWQSLHPHAVFDFVQLKHFIDQGQQIINNQDKEITVQEFAETIALSSQFKEDFLYPFFAASWGVTPSDLKTFAAYEILQWASLGKADSFDAPHWNSINGGMSTYIDALVKQLSSTNIYTSTSIEKIEVDDGGYLLHTSTGQPLRVDHVVLATNAFQAAHLLVDITHAQDLCIALSSIEYFKTTIAIHGDTKFMPDDIKLWSIANIRYDGTHSALTICQPSMKEIPVFRSWITHNLGFPNNGIPQPLYFLEHFYHPKVNKEYFNAQKNIAALQGHNNIWIAGFYTTEIDSHNSAILSAIKIATVLASHSERLKKLLL